jgi:hypothetical protein
MDWKPIIKNMIAVGNKGDVKTDMPYPSLRIIRIINVAVPTLINPTPVPPNR